MIPFGRDKGKIMKKVTAMITVLLICIVSMTGCFRDCIEEDDRNNIIDALTDEDLIPDSWEYIDYKKDVEDLLPTGDARGYYYIYKDEDNQYHTVYMTDLSYENDTTYGDNEIKITGGKAYFLIKISGAEVIKNTENVSGKTYTSYDINTSDYDCDTYLLHYDNFLVFETEKMVAEQVLYYDDTATQPAT